MVAPAPGEIINGNWTDLVDKRGYVASSTRTANSASVTATETVVDSVTFVAKAGHRYKITWEGLYSSSVAGDNGEVRVRYAAGATVTNAGTFIKGKLVQPTVANSTVPITITTTTTALPAGQVTVGALIVRSFGTGNHIAQAATGWAAELIIEDDGS